MCPFAGYLGDSGKTVGWDLIGYLLPLLIFLSDLQAEVTNGPCGHAKCWKESCPKSCVCVCVCACACVCLCVSASASVCTS